VKAAVESVCALCVLAAMMEQMHLGGRFFSAIRLMLGLRIITLFIEILQSLF